MSGRVGTCARGYPNSAQKSGVLGKGRSGNYKPAMRGEEKTPLRIHNLVIRGRSKEQDGSCPLVVSVHAFTQKTRNSDGLRVLIVPLVGEEQWGSTPCGALVLREGGSIYRCCRDGVGGGREGSVK